MTFGVDSDGNPGYIKAGADTVTPFKKGEITLHEKIYIAANVSYNPILCKFAAESTTEIEITAKTQGTGSSLNIIVDDVVREIIPVNSTTGTYTKNITVNAGEVFRMELTHAQTGHAQCEYDITIS